jgi:hypothetical protein
MRRVHDRRAAVRMLTERDVWMSAGLLLKHGADAARREVEGLARHEAQRGNDVAAENWVRVGLAIHWLTSPSTMLDGPAH